MTTYKIITDIRRLCCLGLGGQLLMPTLLHMVQELIPSHSNAFAWADQDGELSNCIAETTVPPDFIQLYLNEFYNKREGGVRPTFTQSIRNEHGVTDWEQYFNTPQFMRSDYYNELLRPLCIRYALRAYVPGSAFREGCNSGVLILHREPRAKPFSERERRILISILPYISHGLNAPSQEVAMYSEGDQCGLIIINQQGIIQDGDAMGRHLLFLAGHPEVNTSNLKNGSQAIPALLSDLVDRLIRIQYGKPAGLPAIQIRSPWGVFVLTAHMLSQSAIAAEPYIGVTIQRRIPLKIKMMQAMKEAPLSAKQKEVCLWLLEGLSQTNIAEQMGISPHSVNDYLKKTYRKLEVHSKDELLRKLLSLEVRG